MTDQRQSEPRQAETPRPDKRSPVLWLLGKTGAGKTSIIRALTGAGVVGDGFRPQTRGIETHDFPAEAPVVRFLDTRGLGEAGYDATADLGVARAAAQAVILVVRLDDLALGPVLAALEGVSLPVMAVFTGADLLSPDDRALARREALALIAATLGSAPAHVTLSLPPDGLVQGVEELLDALDSFLPVATRALRRADEARAFAAVRPMVMRHAQVAGGSDAIPLVGVATVPATQAALLAALARHHGVELTRERLAVLASALGIGALARMGAAHLVRQGAKLVPGVGQTLGAAVAAGASFATTYALGRAASAWLYGVARGREPDAESLRALYEQALRSMGGAR